MKHIAHILAGIALVWLCTVFTEKVIAVEQEAGSAAALNINSTQSTSYDRDPRISTLMRLSAEYGGNFTYQDIRAFVMDADAYDIDWRLVFSIAGVESGFGKRVPYNSYNAWGWGVFTGQKTGAGFTSWQHGIRIVTAGLRERYIDRGRQSLSDIGAIYAADGNWSGKVQFFYNKIDGIYLEERTRILSI